MVFKKKIEQKRFLKFLIVGMISSIVDFGFMNLFTLLFDIPLIIAQALSFLIAVLVSFLLNRFWIYPDSRSKSPYNQLMQFILINLVGIGVRTLLIPVFDRLINSLLSNSSLELMSRLKDVISQNVSLAIVVGFVLLWNFFANRYWTYSDVSSDPAHTL
jgi:putative flippase GtrA